MTPLYNTRWCKRVYSPLLCCLKGGKIFHSFISYNNTKYNKNTNVQKQDRKPCIWPPSRSVSTEQKPCRIMQEETLLWNYEMDSLRSRTPLEGADSVSGQVQCSIRQAQSCKQFITRRRVVWPHLPLFQGCRKNLKLW